MTRDPWSQASGPSSALAMSAYAAPLTSRVVTALRSALYSNASTPYRRHYTARVEGHEARDVQTSGCPPGTGLVPAHSQGGVTRQSAWEGTQPGT